MTTRRIWQVAIAGVVGGMLVSGGLGSLSSVSAQPTKSGIKEKTRETAAKTTAKWESLTPEQQQAYAQKTKLGIDKAQAKWETLTPEQQQQYIAKGEATTQKGRAKWKSLPSGTPPAPGTPPPTPPPPADRPK